MNLHHKLTEQIHALQEEEKNIICDDVADTIVTKHRRTPQVTIPTDRKYAPA
jgi:hypothetical protein